MGKKEELVRGEEEGGGAVVQVIHGETADGSASCAGSSTVCAGH